jgi:hypothetical protein
VDDARGPDADGIVGPRAGLDGRAIGFVAAGLIVLSARAGRTEAGSFHPERTEKVAFTQFPRQRLLLSGRGLTPQVVKWSISPLLLTPTASPGGGEQGRLCGLSANIRRHFFAFCEIH